MNHTNTATNLDETLRVVASPYRRWILYELMNRERGRVDELIPMMRALSAVANSDCIDATRIAIQLHQIHLPKLATAGFIDYDHRSGDIIRTEKFDEIQDQLKIIKTWEDPALRAKINEEIFS